MNSSVTSRQPRKKVRPIGEILVAKGLVSREQLDAVLDEQRSSPRRLGELLVENGLPRDQLNLALAERLGVESIYLGETEVDSLASTLIPEKLARRYQAVAVRFIDDNTLLVAMADPTDVFAIDDLRLMTGFDIRPAIANLEDIADHIARINRLHESIEAQVEETAGVDTDSGLAVDIRNFASGAPIVRLVNSLIIQSVDDRASDLHFEPQEAELTVRHRIDGVLHEVMSIPKKMQPGILSRLKIMADLDIAERRIPQDGRMGLMVGDKPVDVRVASMPTVYGEKIVLRILDKGSVLLNLSDLGFAEAALARYEEAFRRPYGAILVTGPTGSGKSTTLYATLNVLNSREKNIITVEDPVEYRLAGVNQTQIHKKAGLTFASGLRAILRSDPDIVMVGEIRDRETAQIAVEAALTGHMVLSTLHTNNAPGALPRLTEMGIEPFLSASAIECVIAQRLARRLCPHCKEPYQPSEELLRQNGFPPELLDAGVTLFRAKSCSRCNGTGYKGRLGLFEVMPVSEALEQLTVHRKSADEISQAAMAEGMVTLREDGIAKALEGITSMEEVARVVV